MSLSTQQTIETFDTGDTVPLRVEVRDTNGNYADPVNGVAGSYVKPGAAAAAVTLARVTTGVYEGALSPAVGEHGDWVWSAATDGADATIPKMYEEHAFSVRKRKVT